MKTLVLVDIENICKSPIPSRQTVRVAKMMIDRVARIIPDEAFYVLGCHEGLEKTLTTAWPLTDSKGQVNREGFVLSGEDGADKSIVHWLHLNENRKGEWGRIVLVSGDNFFLIPLLAYAPAQAALLQVSWSKSRHHDYARFGKRIKSISLEEITDVPLAKLSFSQADKYINSWFDKTHKTYVQRAEATKQRAFDVRKISPKSKKVSVKPKPYQNPASGNLSVHGKEFSPVRWDKDYDWLFDSTRLYLCSNSYRIFREAAVNTQIQLVLRDGKALSAKKTR